MLRKLIVSLVSAGGALALVLALGVPASSAHKKVDAFVCIVVWRNNHWVTHCGQDQ